MNTEKLNNILEDYFPNPDQKRNKEELSKKILAEFQSSGKEEVITKEDHKKAISELEDKHKKELAELEKKLSSPTEVPEESEKAKKPAKS